MNKVLVFIGLLALLCVYTIANDDSCNPDGKGTPDCTGVKSSSQRYRNNWDPTRYFVCENSDPVEVECGIDTGYDPISEDCISWSDWVWYPPCNSTN